MSNGGGSAGWWPAPGKLNRFLHVVGRRADGYHRLQTVFQFVDRCDYLHFDPRPGGAIRHLTPIRGVIPETDLISRAAWALQAESGCDLGADIRTRKNLPMGGGVGGGSSDAATTLLVLNRLWGTGLPIERLCEVGLALGADVPAFLRGQAAWAEGVGEMLTPLELDQPWFVVAVPAVHVATADVFGDPRLTRGTPEITIRDFLAGEGINDCEPVVFRRYPEVAAAARQLQPFGTPRLTGTGGCVFLAMSAEASARRALSSLHQSGIDGFVARGLNRSPLLDRLSSGADKGEIDTHGA